MKLIPATDFEAVKAKYVDVIDHTPQIEQYARWVYGKHPTDAMLRAHVDRGELYLLTDGMETVGMVVIVMGQGPEYAAVTWAETLANDQVATIHLLAVCPQRQGQGLGSKLLEEATQLAGRCGKKALRLDVLSSNLPARRMYEKAGFVCRGQQHLYAENTGWTDFQFYEKKLNADSFCRLDRQRSY